MNPMNPLDPNTPTSRRALLRAVGGAGALGLAGAAGLAGAPGATAGTGGKAPTFVLVGGNSEASYFWTPVVRALSLLGHRAHPVELPYHGLDAEFVNAYQAPQDRAVLRRQAPALGKVTLDGFRDAIADAVRRVRRHGPVVLVGHSLGGCGITLTANAVPHLVDHLVYVSAICCTARKSALDYILGPENATSLGAPGRLPPNELGDPKRTGATATDFRTADPAWLRAYKRATMAEATESQFLAALNFGNQPIESAGVSLEDARGHARTWGRVPRTYLRLTADRLNTPPNQDRMIADADALTPHNRFAVHDLHASHVGFVLQAGRVAAVLDRVAHRVARGS